MKATLIGHASWLLETAGGNLVTDPVFFDPFEQGAVTSCPKREVDVARLPPLAGIYVSHRHIDHFDFRSLDRLDRALPVWCPDDPLVQAGLRELGFADLRPLAPFAPQTLGDTEIVPVPSYSDEIAEYGAVFRDPSGSFFDQVDCPLTPESMEKIRALGTLDVHVAMYASQSFGFFERRADDVAEVYANNVYAALRLAARLVVPGSAGFRFADDVGWLNKHLFPIASTRFRADLRRLDPKIATVDLLPGDVLSIGEGRVRVEKQASPFVRCVEDDTWRLDHDASAPIPLLEDDNASAYDPDFLRRFAEGLLDNAFVPWVRQLKPGDDEVATTYMEHGVTYEVEVVLPEGPPVRRTFGLGRDGTVTVHADGGPPGQVVERIAASALADVATGRKSAFWSRTRARRSSLVVELGVVDGKLAFDDVRLDDLLSHFVLALRRQKVGEDRALRERLGLYPPEDLIRS